MKKMITYEIPKDEFTDLIHHLRKEGTYEAHGYRFMGFGTIDDKSSTDSEINKRFSEFRDSKKKDDEIILTVHDSSLANVIDSYFKSLN